MGELIDHILFTVDEVNYLTYTKYIGKGHNFVWHVDDVLNESMKEKHKKNPHTIKCTGF